MRFDLPTMEDEAPAAQESKAGLPMLIGLDMIEEDPDQPRKEFDEEALTQLAATIAASGVRSPVSVRPHPREAGRWLLNFGSRRLRASRLAGKTEIPAFVDQTADSYDQVIENEQREGLKPLELALFVKRELERGRTRTDIARRLGKSQGYVSLVCAMIDPPDWLLETYRSGRCRGLTALYELRRLHDADPARVEQELEGCEHIGQREVEQLKKSERLTAPLVNRAHPEARGMSSGGYASTTGRLKTDRSPNAAPAALGLCLTARHEGRTVQVLLDVLPEEVSSVYVALPHSAERFPVTIGALEGLELRRGAPDAAAAKTR